MGERHLKSWAAKQHKTRQTYCKSAVIIVLICCNAPNIQDEIYLLCSYQSFSLFGYHAEQKGLIMLALWHSLLVLKCKD